MIEAVGLCARAGAFALHDVTFTIAAGAYGVVLGPAGAGKTTLLEVIAGIGTQAGGTLCLDGRDVRGTPPEARAVGLVYQHALLFPHLSVAGNVEYGAADAAAVRELTSRLGLGALAGQRVESLSGGERQIVALARALARRPHILLLDEPLGALDPRRRAHVRRELRAIHREWGLTSLHVTHDFAEAGMLGDTVVVLDAGRVLQWGPPAAVFRHPASPVIAEFLGAENVFAGTVLLDGDQAAPHADAADVPRALVFRTGALTVHTVGDRESGPCHAVVRADEVVVQRDAHPSSARNVFRGRVTEIGVAGAVARVVVDVRGTSMVAALTARSAEELALREGELVIVSFKALAVHLC